MRLPCEYLKREWRAHGRRTALATAITRARQRVRCVRDQTSTRTFSSSTLGPAIRAGVLYIGLRSRLSGPAVPTPPLGALGALSSNARTRSLAARSRSPPLSSPSRSLVSLSPRALSRSLPTLSIVCVSSSFALGLWRLLQSSFAAAVDDGSGAAPSWHVFWWVAKFRLALLLLKTMPQWHAAPTTQQALA